MFGLREEFDYVECGRCRCVQIAEVPADLGRYYGGEYYSLSNRLTRKGALKRTLLRLRNRHAITGRGAIGGLIEAALPDRKLREIGRLIPDRGSRVLDVGCGAGYVVHSLYEEGYRNATGIDPFLKEDVHYENGLTLRKMGLDQVEGEFDVILFDHSFEHVPDPEETLRRCQRRLAGGGLCLLRIPTVSSFAWEHYGTDWVQFDAPRHLFLHSVESVEVLAAATGFRVEQVLYNSDGFQFWGSELYRRDIPLRSPGTGKAERKGPLAEFSRQQLREYEARSRALNAERRGDQATFVLRKQEEGSPS